jgi:hypothetical protein
MRRSLPFQEIKRRDRRAAPKKNTGAPRSLSKEKAL